MLKDSVNLVAVTMSAFFCISGQMPRKEIEEVPSTQCVTQEIEVKQEEPPASQERNSAAKKSMEDQITAIED